MSATPESGEALDVVQPSDVQVRRALLSVSDKRGLVDFAKGLADLGVEIVSTGGTARALAELIRALGGIVVGCAFLVELAFLDGRRHLEGIDVFALVTYDGDE